MTLIIKSESLIPKRTILDELQSAKDNAFATVRKEKRKSFFSIFCFTRKKTSTLSIGYCFEKRASLAWLARDLNQPVQNKSFL